MTSSLEELKAIPFVIAAIQPPAEQAANNQGVYFDPHVIGALIGGLLLGWFAQWLTTRRDAAGRRRAFRDFLAALNDEFFDEWNNVSAMDKDAFDNWNRLASHFASLPRVKAEATKVRESICWWDRRRFKAACVAYYEFGAEPRFESNHSEFARVRQESSSLLESLNRYAS